MEENLLQAQELRAFIVPVAVGADEGRLQEADLVIVMQRPDGDA